MSEILSVEIIKTNAEAEIALHLKYLDINEH